MTGIPEVPETIDSQDCLEDTNRCEADVSRLRGLLGDCATLVDCNAARGSLYAQMKELAAAMNLDLVPHSDIEVDTTCEAALQTCTTDRTKMEGILTDIDAILAEEG